MFSKGSKPTPPSEPARTAKTSVETAEPPVMMTSDTVPSIISNDLKIVGNLESTGDIQIDGTIQGDIRSLTLTIGESAHVKGSVYAESVRVCGHVSGEIKCTNVILAKTARVEGDVAHQSLAIEAGAYIEGNIRRLEERKTSDSGSKLSVLKPGDSKGEAASDTDKGGITSAKPATG